MPITNVDQVKRFTQMCGASIPTGLLRELELRADQPDAVADFGVAYATMQCADLLANGAPGIHFYTLNRSPSTRAILCALRCLAPWRRAVSAASAAAAAGLGGVELAVGGLDQLHHVGAVGRGHRHADGDAERVLAGDELDRQAVLDVLDDRGGGAAAGLLAVAHPDAELVAAEPAGDAVAGEHARDLGEDEVAGAVAVGVVDALEAVDVADQHGAERAGGEVAADGLDPGAAVVQAGQVVGVGDGLEAPDGLGQVAGGAGGGDAGLLGDLVEQLRPGAEALEGDAQQGPVGLAAGDHVGEHVGHLDAGGLVGRAGEAGRAAVVVGDRAGDVVVGLGQADQQRAGGGVVEAEQLALEFGARRAVGRLGGDVLDRLDAERGRHQELADVVQEAAEVRRVGVGAAQVGGRGGVGGDGDGVHVELAAGEWRRRGRRSGSGRSRPRARSARAPGGRAA